MLRFVGLFSIFFFSSFVADFQAFWPKIFGTGGLQPPSPPPRPLRLGKSEKTQYILGRRVTPTPNQHKISSPPCSRQHEKNSSNHQKNCYWHKSLNRSCRTWVSRLIYGWVLLQIPNGPSVICRLRVLKSNRHSIPLMTGGNTWKTIELQCNVVGQYRTTTKNSGPLGLIHSDPSLPRSRF